MKPDIYHVELIGSGSLSVMAKPVTGEWIRDEFKAIAELGITKVVSLLEAQEAHELGLADEKALVESNGMKFSLHPIRDRGLPSSAKDYLHFTKELYQQAAGGEHIVIHCHAGIGRTGLVAAGVLLHCGFEPQEAFELISSKRGVSVPDTNEQIDWVEECYAIMCSGS